jgi:hypothetical protein
MRKIHVCNRLCHISVHGEQNANGNYLVSFPWLKWVDEAFDLLTPKVNGSFHASSSRPWHPPYQILMNLGMFHPFI